MSDRDREIAAALADRDIAEAQVRRLRKALNETAAERNHARAEATRWKQLARAAERAAKRVQAEAWDRGYAAGGSRQRRRWSDEPNVPDAVNPYRPEGQQ